MKEICKMTATALKAAMEGGSFLPRPRRPIWRRLREKEKDVRAYLK